MSEEKLLARIHHGFDHLDADGDGLVTEHDHVLMGRAVARSLGHAEESTAEERIVDAYLAIWRDLHVSQLPAGTTAVGRAQFVAATRSLADDPVAARTVYGALAEAYLAIADVDGSGTVDAGEFFVFQRGNFSALSRDDADEAFHRLDLDGDGLLSAEEFVAGLIEFWTSREPEAPGHWWAGRPPYAV
ncbi:EF-hand domain-containing protein [Kitasatospora misakiensis]|uniref:EF-hand domain-containing protein n=1 Tax=Kitasatospora misakiensis TaxID=67330 RepID=A0ABW0XDH2_9ACTN